MTETTPLVYVVVVTYDGKRFLEGCLRTLHQTVYEHVRFLLLDNGSSDGSAEFVRERFPGVEIVRLNPNVGFMRAANTAIRHAADRGADYVVVCNDDIELIDRRWLEEAVALAKQDRHVGIVGFTEESTRDAIMPQRITAIDEEHLIGFALLFRTSLLEQIGGFDEDYCLFEVEMDLEARARRAGYRVVRLNIPVYHLGGGTLLRSSRRTAYLQMASGLRFCLKNRHPLSVFLRIGRYLDIACNPWPLTFRPDDHGHCRIRNTGNLLLNLPVLVRAVTWNLVALPRTFRSRKHDRRRADQAEAHRPDGRKQIISNPERQVPV